MTVRALLLLSFIALAAETQAQEPRSILRGTVLGADSLPAAGVEMVIVSEGTGDTRPFTSDRQGRFVLLQVAPGAYRIESEDDRFPTFVARVTVGLNETVEITLPLAAPTISAAIDFRSFEIPIDRYGPSIRTRLPGDFIAELPLDGRSAWDAVLLAPGFTAAPLGPVAAGSDIGTTYLLNGLTNMEPLLGVGAVRPQVEGLRELEMARASFDASFGATAGGYVHAVTRSGTNRPGGGAFGFFQTEAERRQFGVLGGGPLVKNRTFAFGEYQHTGFGGNQPSLDSAHDLTARLDQVLGGMFTATYALADGSILDRRGQHFGVSFAHLPSATTANHVRFGVSRVDFAPVADVGGIAESQSYELADTFTWSRGAHVIRTGAEWYAFSRGLDSGELAAQTWSGFIQDEWRASASLSLSGGVRVSRLSRNDADVESRTDVSPVAGFAWTTGEEASAVVVRGGYGRAHHQVAAFSSTPALDHWSLGAEKQWGRTRTVEAAYVGASGSDLYGGDGSSRYNGFLFEMQQRSETGVTGHLAYAHGRWSSSVFEGPRLPHPLDARHTLTGAFTAWLPVGDERRWFSSGVAGKILKDVQVAGVLGIVGDYRSLDLALVKNWRAPGDNRRLQVRFETFNVMNRSNGGGLLFSPDPLTTLFGSYDTGRRYQFGGRFAF